MRTASSGFRTDIEGLRALAIFFVVSAHADLLGLTGGFTGVDVFFVLSGYLITGQLIEEQRRSDRIDLLRFYARRMRRLLPAALLVLVASLLLVWQFLPPSMWQEQSLAAAAAAVWMSNLHFTFARFDYFGGAAAENLFLHTWSLSVEEQFYLFWPLLLIAAAALAPQRRERGWPLVLWIVLGLSLLACLWPSQDRPLAAFYLMPSRAWQFALGGLCWLFARSAKERAAPILAGLGLILLVASGWGLHESLRYPSYWALLPSTGTALLLIAGTVQPGNLVSRTLSISALQWLGQRSYALYLWHWPILLVGRDQLGMDSVVARAALMLLALALAAVTHTAVETPLRRWSLPLQRPGKTVLVGLGLALLSAAFVMRIFSGPPTAASQIASPPSLPLIYAQGCDDWYQSAQLKVCAYGDPDAPRTVIALGDSIGLQWFPAFHRMFAEQGWKLLVMTKSSCPIVDEAVFEQALGREFTECAEWRKAALEAIAEIAPNLVIIGSTDSYPLSLSQWTEGSARTFAAISHRVGRIVVLRATPRLPSNTARCAEPRSALYTLMSRRDLCVSPAEDPSAKAIFLALQTATGRFENVTALDLNRFVCPDGECKALREGMLIFRDQQHLNADFVVTLAASLATALQASD